ncbi:hypothetical protein BSG1_18825 [Bacillus sp. SG-1]|nr:hypothetical protein BSG1_18825 [Bacillus sp. SG-1]
MFSYEENFHQESGKIGSFEASSSLLLICKNTHFFWEGGANNEKNFYKKGRKISTFETTSSLLLIVVDLHTICKDEQII